MNICEVESGPTIRRQMREKTALTSDLTTKVAQQTKDGHMGVLPVLLIDTLKAVQVGRSLMAFSKPLVNHRIFLDVKFFKIVSTKYVTCESP